MLSVTNRKGNSELEDRFSEAEPPGVKRFAAAEIRRLPDFSSSYLGCRYLAGLARSMKRMNDAQLPDEQDEDSTRDFYAAPAPAPDRILRVLRITSTDSLIALTN